MDVMEARSGWRRCWSVARAGVVVLALLLAGCALDAPAASNRRQESLQRMRAESAFADAKAQELAVAAALGDAATIRRLMRDEGVDPDLVFGGRNGGMPLLAWPIHAGNPEGLRAMLENGADPNAARPYPRREGFTPTNHSNAMVWASEQEDPTYLNLLLDHGGDPDTRNANNEALLFHAFIKQNQWRNVQVLVERGADVNANVAAGGTIISLYATRGGFMMTHWLLEHGADPTLDYAFGKPVQRPDSHTIEAVFWHPGNPDDPTWQRKCQQWLLAHGHARPPMPEHYRLMRERLGVPHREEDIPLL